MIEIESFLKNVLKIDKKTPIVVAVSGGPDSMALLSLLESYFETIICAHVNHNTGRVGQVEDELFVKEYCSSHHFHFESMTITSYSKSNFHHEAHKIRYQFFEQILKKYDSKYLFTAHHGDDLMETMLFRMMRGSTIHSLHGFSKISKQKNFYLVRPLLEYTKEQLLQYNIHNQIPYQIDPSNEKEIYTRNRIRKQLLPFFKKENANIHLKFLKLSEELEQVDQFVEIQVKKEEEKRFIDNTLSLEGFEQLDYVIQKRLLQHMLGHIYDSLQEQLNQTHIELLFHLIFHSSSGTELNFPQNIIIRKEYQTLIIVKDANSYEFEIKDNLILSNGHQIKVVKEEETDSNFVCRLSKEEIKFPLIVRTRREKDRMMVKGMNGSKKIQDIFINEKIPLHERQIWPIVTDQTGKIVWLPGLKKSHFDKTKEEKYDIILRYY